MLPNISLKFLLTAVPFSRQSNTDKAASAVKPDSQKSITEQAGDSIKGTADSVAGTVQPQGEKSTTQKASDAVTGDGKDAGKEGQTYVSTTPLCS